MSVVDGNPREAAFLGGVTEHTVFNLAYENSRPNFLSMLILCATVVAMMSILQYENIDDYLLVNQF